MNVKREIDAANRRIQEQVDASARAALIRIGVDVDAMDREEAEQRVRRARESFAAFGEAVGTAINGFIGLATAFADGVQHAMEQEIEESKR